MSVYLGARFQVCSIILTGFRQRDKGEEVILPCPHPPPWNEPLKSPPRLGLTRTTEPLILPRQEQAMRTNNIKAKVENKEMVKVEWVEKL